MSASPDGGIRHVIWSASDVPRNPIESSSRLRNTMADTISSVIIEPNCRILVQVTFQRVFV
ncbi:unnamed protein product [Musa textilis]